MGRCTSHCIAKRIDITTLVAQQEFRESTRRYRDALHCRTGQGDLFIIRVRGRGEVVGW